MQRMVGKRNRELREDTLLTIIRDEILFEILIPQGTRDKEKPTTILTPSKMTFEEIDIPLPKLQRNHTSSILHEALIMIHM
ncbi:hypothetical protein J1N35_001988 [Gossypium stocksii]|uniref:Uncharacterized protein n=1 Tax=Gossypium stocksii TaxID=47602 RepID=A0A9D3WKW6_9ROSI|nr:hypothetical protein J1N35_001988 [Gossypium stocksii]